MKKVRAYFSMGLVGCKREEILEFEDGTDDEAIEEEVRDWMFNFVEWGFTPVEGADED